MTNYNEYFSQELEKIKQSHWYNVEGVDKELQIYVNQNITTFSYIERSADNLVICNKIGNLLNELQKLIEKDHYYLFKTIPWTTVRRLYRECLIKVLKEKNTFDFNTISGLFYNQFV